MGRKKSGTNVTIHLRRISWILVSKDPDISLDLDLRLGLIPLTTSLPQIYPVHLALVMSISNFDIISGMVLRNQDVDRGHIKKNKPRKRFETITTDSESEVHVDTEVDTAVDSDNALIPSLCHIEVEIENKTSSSNTVNLKLPNSTGKKKMKKRNNKDDQRENSETLSELWPKSSKYYEKINTKKESNSAFLALRLPREGARGGGGEGG